MAVTVTAVVPTVGASPLLAECLRALRSQRLGAGLGPGRGLEIVLVRQGSGAGPNGAGRPGDADRQKAAPPVPLGSLVDREIRLPRNLGFAAATNRGIAVAAGPYVATVNDDVVVEAGWLDALVQALEADPGAAAAQGVNLQPSGEPEGVPSGSVAPRPGERVDGWGLAWNRAFQAVQLGRDEPPPDPTEAPRAVFGVSATAAVYRCDALLRVARRDRRRSDPGADASGSTPDEPDAAVAPEVFDGRLESYYEDVDLACRLRAAGFSALSVPAARALHAGSLTGRRLGARRWRLLYGNRYAVAAGMLGRSLWRHLPRMALRDLADLSQAVRDGEGSRAFGILGGWGRALRLSPGFAHRGTSAPRAPAAATAPAEGREPAEPPR